MADNELVRIQQPTQTGLIPKTIEAALDMAKMMSSAKLVPTHLRESPGDCLLVINQAVRWGLDPLAVAQATAVVQGKLCYEGKLVAAVLVATGSIKGRPDYEFTGSGDDRTITITACTADGKPRSITGCVREWKSNNRYWLTQPDDMLIYRGIRQWARRYAPEAVLGIVTPDEMLEEKTLQQAAPQAGRKPAAPVEVIQEKPAAPPAPSIENFIDAEEVVLDSGAILLKESFAVEIGGAESQVQLLEIKNKMQQAYGSNVPEELKNAWAKRKKATR